ncbi:MAG: aldo/keto reductase [Gammaproteobacteria bacterium]
MITRRALLKGSLVAGVALALGTARNAFASGNGSGLITKAIPASGERIPVIGIGTARRFDVGPDAPERAVLREVLRQLPKLGGTLVDTAPSYGRAETVIGELIEELGNREQLFIATKVGAGRNGLKAALEEMEGSFARLRTDRFDLLQVHNLSGIDEVLPVLREWKAEGRIRYLGMSTSFDRQYGDFVRVMEREDLDFIQVDYAIDNRDAEQRILPLAAERGIAVLTNLPFGRGRVFDAFGNSAVPEWARATGIETWAQFSLKWVVSHPAVTCAIPGTATLEYLNDNLAAAHGPLPDPEMRTRMAALVSA